MYPNDVDDKDRNKRFSRIDRLLGIETNNNGRQRDIIEINNID